MALTILSGISAGDFMLCVQNRDVGALTCLPGIGKKTAERLLVEMQDRLELPGEVISATGVATAGMTNPVNDAVSALVALGFKQADADRMIKQVAADDMSSEELIREALKAQAR